MANPIMQHFHYDHLPAGPLRNASAPFGELAHFVDEHLGDGPEKSVALRKLLEAKDAAVRQAVVDRDAADRIPTIRDGAQHVAGVDVPGLDAPDAIVSEA